MRVSLLFSLFFAAGCMEAPSTGASATFRSDDAWLAEVEDRIAVSARAIHARDGGFAADLPSLGLNARFGVDGVSLADRSGELLTLRTRAWGREGDLRESAPGAPQLGTCTVAEDLDGSCVRRLEYRGDDLDEWWVGLGTGLEQGWTVHRAPEGDGPLVVEVEVVGAVAVEVGDDDATITDVTGRDWSVGSLVAWDAEGVVLPTRIVQADGGLRIEVDDEGATFPIEIDPVYQAAAWTVTGGDDTGREFAHEVAGAGDVNGDGFDDVIVGAHWYSNLAGRALVFYGSADGLPTSPDVVLDGTSLSHFGYKVGTAGDVNGDGYDDVIVGAYYVGKAFVFHGGAAGLSTTAATVMVGNANTAFGVSASSAGDINGDGFGDVIIGEHMSSNFTGRAFVYYGTASGLPTSPATMVEGSRTSSNFGWTARGGDVNGDGYGDVVVSAWGWDNSRGRVYVYHGGRGGLNTSASRSLLGESTQNYFGFSVDTADVNADGYDDLLIGAHYTNSHRGRLYVYYGSASGIPTTAGLKVDGEVAGDDFGFSVSRAGDVNADGFEDVIVGAQFAGGTGRAYVFHGGASGLSSTAAPTLLGETSPPSFGASVASAGDVDGDGYDDVLVAASYYGNYTGRAYLYLGYADADGDGVPAESDCDDTNASVATGWVDTDGDGYGSEAAEGCPGDPGVVAAEGDCDDADAAVHPGAEERCDGVDGNCDGALDDGAIDVATWYLDADADGIGGDETSIACDAPEGHVGRTGDCNDEVAGISPDAVELCDALDVDENCDGTTDGTLDVDSDGVCDERDACPLDFADDSDGDGACDSNDVCPGGDDRVDGDTDGTPDTCDACPIDFNNDSDGDRSCDSADPCPLDAADDADADGRCAEVDPCPYDADDDLDLDGVCGDVDACPADAANDADGDGICGNIDACAGYDDREDADGDGAADGCDRCPSDAANDADADGACADVDICPLDAADDEDGDGACADVDVCPLDAADDLDGDGMCADVDPCPDNVENDADGDGLCEDVDNCPSLSNPGQADADSDGHGDECEPDNDLDGVIDDLDNCPMVTNPDQDDTDGDAAGDACDADDDGDGVGDGLDACSGTSSTSLVLSDGCSVVESCPCDAGWKNQGAYQTCVGSAADELVRGGGLSSGGPVRSEAAKLSCGSKKHVHVDGEDDTVAAASARP